MNMLKNTIERLGGDRTIERGLMKTGTMISKVTNISMVRWMIKVIMEGVAKNPVDLYPSKALNGTTVYINIPFCKSRCAYCGFYTNPYKKEKVEKYIEDVKREISIYKEKLGDFEIGDVYFGGGTPSLAWEGVIDIINHLKSNFKITGDIGMEANPVDIDDEMCDALLKNGVSKISLGVQSFDEKLLKSMGRTHDGDLAFKKIELLLNKGFDTTIDLIFQLPGQTIDSLLNDLKKADESGVHHICYYPLILMPFTRWGDQFRRGELDLPSGKTQREMIYAIYDFFSSRGYVLGVGGFERKGMDLKEFFTCPDAHTIGIGSGAFAKIMQTGTFYMNYPIDEYSNAVRDGRLPIAMGISIGEERMDKIFSILGHALGVDTEDLKKGIRSTMSFDILNDGGIDKGMTKERFGRRAEDILDIFSSLLRIFGLIEEESGAMKPTREAMREAMYYGFLGVQYHLAPLILFSGINNIGKMIPESMVGYTKSMGLNFG
jgi:oxygen-independent coproporphyrinogen-3 oxidase